MTATLAQMASPIGPAGKANGVPRSCIRVLRFGTRPLMSQVFLASGLGFGDSNYVAWQAERFIHGSKVIN